MEITRANRPVADRVVEEVSTAEGVSPSSLPPLYDAVDPEALETLLTSTRDGQSAPVRVSFPYEGYTVTVTDGGEVTVEKSAVA